MTGPREAAQQLGRRLNELHQVIEELREAEAAAVSARREANVEEWKAFLSSQGPVDQRKIAARLATEQLAFVADLAEAEVRHLVRSMKEAQARIDAGRTYSADLRAELATLGRDGAA